MIDKEPKDLSKLTDKQKAYTLLKMNGMTQASASRALGMDRRNATKLEKSVKKKVGKLTHNDLVSSFFATPARRALKKMLQGKKFGDIEKMPAGIVLDAIKMVKEEISPTVKQAHITHDSVLSPTIVDVTPNESEVIDDDQ